MAMDLLRCAPAKFLAQVRVDPCQQIWPRDRIWYAPLQSILLSPHPITLLPTHLQPLFCPLQTLPSLACTAAISGASRTVKAFPLAVLHCGNMHYDTFMGACTSRGHAPPALMKIQLCHETYFATSFWNYGLHYKIHSALKPVFGREPEIYTFMMT